MAKAVIQANIQTSNGVISVAPNASIAIRDADSGSLVSLWSDRDGVSSITNPTQADENGDFKVYANYGRVNITATLGASTKTWSDVVIFDEADKFYPNDIINGNFKIAQAGTSFAAAANAAYDLDGWYVDYSTAAAVTVSQQTGGSTGKYARRVAVTTADTSIAAGDVFSNSTKIEGYDAVRYLNNTFTIGFLVKSSVIGTHCLAIYNGTSTYVAEYTIDVANILEYKIVTVTGGTPALASTTNTYGLILRWANIAGSTYQTTAGAWNTGNFHGTASQVNDFATVGNIFELQDITLNLGTSVAAIEPSYEQLLARCQRYYLTTDRTIVNNVNVSYYQGAGLYTSHMMEFPVAMRVAPTATIAGTWTVNNCGQPAFIYTTTVRAGFQALTTALGFSHFYNSDPATMYLEFSARL